MTLDAVYHGNNDAQCEQCSVFLERFKGDLTTMRSSVDKIAVQVGERRYIIHSAARAVTVHSTKQAVGHGRRAYLAAFIAQR